MHAAPSAFVVLSRLTDFKSREYNRIRRWISSVCVLPSHATFITLIILQNNRVQRLMGTSFGGCVHGLKRPCLGARWPGSL